MCNRCGLSDFAYINKVTPYSLERSCLIPILIAHYNKTHTTATNWILSMASAVNSDCQQLLHILLHELAGKCVCAMTIKYQQTRHVKKCAKKLQKLQLNCDRRERERKNKATCKWRAPNSRWPAVGGYFLRFTKCLGDL